MRTGDLILVKYKLDPISYLVRKLTKSNWNHIVWVIDKETILEVTNRGIKLSPMNKYNNKYLYETKVIRLKNISSKKLDLIMGTEKIWTNYTWYNLPRYKLPLLFTFLAIGFKMKVNRFVCSSYIAYILKQHDVIIANKNIMYVTPEDIISSGKVKEINSLPTGLTVKNIKFVWFIEDLRIYDIVLSSEEIMDEFKMKCKNVKDPTCCKNPDITVAIDNINNKKRTYCFNCNRRLK